MSAYDVIVIGAGIAGAGVAAELCANRRVLVLERESHAGAHATGRSAALFSAAYGGPLVRALTRATWASLAYPPAELADASLLTPRGCLVVATPAQIPALEAFAGQPDIAALGDLLDAGDALRLAPILRPDYLGRAWCERDAADIDVDRLHQGYLRLVRARGGEVRFDAPAQAFARVGGAWIVEAAGEHFAAPVVINAAGAWADAVAARAGVAPLGLLPRLRTAVLVDAPEGVALDHMPVVMDIDEQFYFKPDAGRLLLSPADEQPCEPCDAQPSELDVAIAVARVEEATTLRVRRVRHSWAGLRTFVADRAPVAGYAPDAPGFFWLAGQGGYGIQTSVALNRAAAALVLGEPLPQDITEAGVCALALAPERLRTS